MRCKDPNKIDVFALDRNREHGKEYPIGVIGHVYECDICYRDIEFYYEIKGKPMFPKLMFPGRDKIKNQINKQREKDVEMSNEEVIILLREQRLNTLPTKELEKVLLGHSELVRKIES